MKYTFADCQLDTDQRLLSRTGNPVRIEPQVFDLIRLLVENPDRVVTRDEIVEEVWGGRIVSESAISARIAAARKAVGDDGKRQEVIRTVARRGLQMVARVTVNSVGPQAEAMPPGRTWGQRIRYASTPTGHSIAYAVMGDGPPVIRVGHLNGDLEGEWQIEADRLAFETISQSCTLVRFDPVGCGQSDPSLDRLQVAQMAEDIGVVADALGLKRFALLSESGGCKPALHFAAHHPERVTRLAMVGGYVDGRALRRPDNEPDSLRAMMAEGWGQSNSPFVTAFMLSYLPEGPLASVTEIARMLQTANSPDYVLRLRDISNRHSAADLLPRITCPTLILHGRHDGVHPLTEARKLASGIAGAELAVFETANHIPIPGNAVWPDYIATLADFLAQP